MRSFIVLLLILVLAKAVPVSKKLSVKGYYPHDLLTFFLVAIAPFPLKAALVDPKKDGFIPRDVMANPAAPHWWFCNGGPADKESLRDPVGK